MGNLTTEAVAVLTAMIQLSDMERRVTRKGVAVRSGLPLHRVTPLLGILRRDGYIAAYGEGWRKDWTVIKRPDGRRYRQTERATAEVRVTRLDPGHARGYFRDPL